MPVALITGATKGIGLATARAFAAAGFDLALVARDPSALVSLADELGATGVTVSWASIDLADPGAIEASITSLFPADIAPDVVINNAGAAYTGSLVDMSLDRWQWLIQLNVTSVLQVCRAVVPLMRLAGGGRIINVSSHAANHAFPSWGAYCISKAALASFSRCLAVEERQHGIQVSTLTLGAVNTPLWDSETVDSSFDRRAMLDASRAAEALLYLAQQPSTQVVEDLTLMPAAGVL
ncbi:MAG: SDR family oxidoreductase [Cyanobacteriota bacterium]